MRGGYSREAAESFQPTPDLPFVTCWFTLAEPPAVYGWNEFEIEIVNAGSDTDREIFIEEREVFVIPDMRSLSPNFTLY